MEVFMAANQLTKGRKRGYQITKEKIQERLLEELLSKVPKDNSELIQKARTSLN
jgi:hypothetical protein